MLKKLSSSLVAVGIVFFICIILVIPDVCIAGASSGLLLWFHKLLPSLLPFIILINMLCYLGVISQMSKVIHPFSSLLFGVSGTSFMIFVMGLIAGYPMGAKLTKQLLDQNQISYEEAQKSLCFSTNCGPLFIIGTVGTLLLGNVSLGYFIAFIHILSSLFMLLLSRFYRISKTTPRHPELITSPPPSFYESFSRSVQNGMDTIVCVGGYIIFFSMIINILRNSQLFNQLISLLSNTLSISSDTLYQLILGSLEFSNGSALISSIYPFSLHHLSLLTGLITFGGFCVFFQCNYVLNGAHLKLSLYLISKVFQGIIAYILSFILYPFIFKIPSEYSFIHLIVFFFISILLIFFYSYHSNHSLKSKSIR